MSGENIDEFNKNALKVFSILYGKFPVPVGLEFFDLSEEAEQESHKMGGLSNEETIARIHTMYWLVDHGYIDAKKTSDGLLFASLTPLGLKAMNSTPKSLEGKDSVGKQILSWAKDGAKKEAKERAQELINEVLSNGSNLLDNVIG